MGNAWFQFKQFRVEQAGAAMKVGTDACILGAWAQHSAPERILDIGTGTGLLSLMLAQRYECAQIEALEPEPEAARHAEENFSRSPWSDRLKLHDCVVQEFLSENKFDLIVCNPPFYSDHLKTEDSRRNMALHQEILRFDELASACTRLLHQHGICYVLLPPRQANDYEQECARNGLFVNAKLLIRERENSTTHRTIFAYGHKHSTQILTTQLTIRSRENHYSEAFRQILHPYYSIF